MNEREREDQSITSKPSKNDAADVARQIGLKSSDRGGMPREPQDCGDFDMRIARDGTWFYRGSPIGRKPLVKLFSTVLRRDSAGVYWLQTPVERGRIAVDDAPFVAVAMEAEGTGHDQTISFTTNLDQTVTAGAAHPIRVAIEPETGAPSPYVLIRDGLEALIARAVFYDMVERAEERIVDGRPVLGVWSEGCFFTLGPIDS